MSAEEKRGVNLGRLNEFLKRSGGNEGLYEYLRECRDEMGGYRYESGVGVEKSEDYYGEGEEISVLRGSEENICMDIYNRAKEL